MVIVSNGVLIPVTDLVSIFNLVFTSLITFKIFILWVLFIALLALLVNSLIFIILLLLLVFWLYLYKLLYLGSINGLINYPIAISTNCWLYIAIGSLSSLYSQSFSSVPLNMSGFGFFFANSLCYIWLFCIFSIYYCNRRQNV